MYANKIELQDTFYKGDIVATPQGRGKIAKVKREPFEFPTAPGKTQRINARLNQPVYIVGFEDRAAVYEAHNIFKSSYEEDGTPNQGTGRAVATVSYNKVDTDRLPDYLA